MRPLGWVADWWAEKKQISDEALNAFVDEHPNAFAVVVASGLRALTDFSDMMLDITKIGEGVEKGRWGYAEDALRLLSLAGPLAKGSAKIGNWVLSTHALKAVRHARIIDRTLHLPSCVVVAATNALRITGTRAFATLEDIFSALSDSQLRNIVKTGGKGLTMGDVLPIIRQLGASVRELKSGLPKTIEEVTKIVRANPRSVLMYGIKWYKEVKEVTKVVVNGKEVEVTVKKVVECGHAILSYFDPIKGLRIVDRCGEFGSFEEMVEFIYQGERLGYGKGIKFARVDLENAVVLIDDAFIAVGEMPQSIMALTENLGALTRLAFELQSVLLVRKKDADSMFNNICDRITGTLFSPAVRLMEKTWDAWSYF
jgi:hypothetical protein